MPKIIESYIRFAALKDVKMSPSYMDAKRGELFALMRQEGPPTWFYTFSPNDTQWRHLLNAILHLRDEAMPSDEQLAELLNGSEENNQLIADLLRSDPVS